MEIRTSVPPDQGPSASPLFPARQRANPDKLRVCVVGAGHGGTAVAGYLGLKGLPVVLYNRTPDKLEAIRAQGGVRLEGSVTGFGRLTGATSVAAEALTWADLVLVVVPATAHAPLAREFSPFLRADHTVVLIPGRTLGAIEFLHTACGRNDAAFIIAETQTLPFASRLLEPGTVRILARKNTLAVAALPAARTQEVIRTLGFAFPSVEIKAAAHVLELGMNNMGAMLHPLPLLLSSGRVEGGERFEFYHQGFTSAVGKALEVMDRERRDVARALGVKVLDLRSWLRESYGATVRRKDLAGAIRGTKAYSGITAPHSLDTRYFTEDVPTGLVPMRALGKLVSVATPTMDSVIALSSAVTGQDFARTGRQLENLGLGNASATQILSYVISGRKPARRKLRGRVPPESRRRIIAGIEDPWHQSVRACGLCAPEADCRCES
ncbi:MAG: NAD/NADP octopine/nopaline dehydrogenase family protein [Firmicutes bacterium]|nr:NAD/NADP octopine/nopaline dehydrogenase family protein [Bacillota bacterium]